MIGVIFKCAGLSWFAGSHISFSCAGLSWLQLAPCPELAPQLLLSWLAVLSWLLCLIEGAAASRSPSTRRRCRAIFVRSPRTTSPWPGIPAASKQGGPGSCTSGIDQVGGCAGRSGTGPTAAATAEAAAAVATARGPGCRHAWTASCRCRCRTQRRWVNTRVRGVAVGWVVGRGPWMP